MTSVIERKQDVVPKPESDAAAFMHIIERAARDPAVDIEKMERLMQMHERIKLKEAEKEFSIALTACQMEMRQVATDSENPQTRSKYASYAKLDQALRPIYTRHGFALSFDEGDSGKPEYVRVLCYVSHVGGFTRMYHRDIPADGKGAKGGDVMTKTHAAGAAGSYGARYLLKGIFNVAIGEYDDDGNGNLGEGLDVQVRAAYIQEIDAAVDEATLKAAFRKAWKVAELAKDKGSMRLFTEHKDAKKRALAAK